MTRSLRRMMIGLSVVVLAAAGVSMLANAPATAVTPSLTWSAPQLADPPGTVGAVSCVPPAASLGYRFCQVVDSIGQAGRYFPTVVNGPSVFTDARAGDTPLVSVSCVSFTFCLAVDGSGGVYGYNGAWQQRVVKDGTLATTSISCATTTFCALIDPSGVVAYRNGAWQPRVAIPSSALHQISCSGSTCVIIGTDGSVVTYGGSSWSAPAALDPHGLASVSCASSTYCVAIDANGATYTYNGTTWSAASSTGLARASSISCASSSFCVAGSKSGSVALWNGAIWTVQRNVVFQTVDGAHVAQPIVGISCGAPTFCMAVDRYSDYAVYDGATWSNPAIATDVFSTLTGSCLSATFCIALDSHGRTLTYNGTRWSKPRLHWDPVPTFRGCPSRTVCVYSDVSGRAGEVVTITAQQEADQEMGGTVTDVSCATAHFCVAVDDIGETAVYQPSIAGVDLWGAVTQTDDAGVALRGVSCPAVTFCVALDAEGRALYYNGSVWSAPTAPVTAAVIQTLSCAAVRLCFAIQGSGTVLRYDAGRWTSSTIDTAMLTGLSCARKSTSCLAVDSAGNALTFDGSAWSEPAPINSPAQPVSQPTCASPAFCMVVGAPGYVQFGTG